LKLPSSGEEEIQLMVQKLLTNAPITPLKAAPNLSIAL
jgi:hypothetical protein